MEKEGEGRGKVLGVGREGRGGRRVAGRLGSGIQGITPRFGEHTVEEFSILAQFSAWEGTGKERVREGVVGN